ncbi:MAG: hypothetical protein WCF44_19345 [Candidatus Methylophosphatis roskildensis]
MAIYKAALPAANEYAPLHDCAMQIAIPCGLQADRRFPVRPHAIPRAAR